MEYQPRSAIVGSHTMHIFNNIRYCQLFSKVVPICIPMKSVREFLFLSIFTNTCYYRIFNFCQSYGYVMVSSCGLKFKATLNVICVFSFASYSFRSFAHFFIWVVFFSLFYGNNLYTHTDTDIYIYIYNTDFFVYGLRISSTLFFFSFFKKIVP